MPGTTGNDLRVVLAKYGLWAVVALYMIWFVTEKVDVRLQALQHSVDQHVADQAVTKIILFNICLNTAANDVVAQARCRLTIPESMR